MSSHEAAAWTAPSILSRVVLVDDRDLWQWTVVMVRRNHHTGDLCVHIADDGGGVIVVDPSEIEAT